MVNVIANSLVINSEIEFTETRDSMKNLTAFCQMQNKEGNIPIKIIMFTTL